MNVQMIEQMVEQVDQMIETLMNDESECFVALEVAQHFRDELVQLIPEQDEDE